MRKASKLLFNKREKQYDKTSNQYENLAKRYGLDSENVVLDLNIAEDQSQSFNSVQEAENANLPIGTEVTIGGRRAVIE